MTKRFNKKVKDTFKAFLVEGANFTKNEEYPIIEKWMVPEEPPIKIIAFNESKKYKDDKSIVYVCHFTGDERFDQVRTRPRQYVSYFKQFAGVIGFDYSIHYDMPIIKQKAQMNDNLSLTYYYGKKGIKVIPNIRLGIEELDNEFLSALPKNSLVAIGVHGFRKTKLEQYRQILLVKKVIESLNPSGIVVYGKINNELEQYILSKTNLYQYDSWIEEREKYDEHKRSK